MILASGDPLGRQIGVDGMGEVARYVHWVAGAFVELEAGSLRPV